jgi:ubiquinone biosynthesis protein COQ4
MSNDVPYLLRGMNPTHPVSSGLKSSSRYLNNAAFRDWVAFILLKRNGPDIPPQAEMYDFLKFIPEVYDLALIEELFTRERKRLPKLDAWFNERYVSTYSKPDLAQFAPETVGGTFYKYLARPGFEVEIVPWTKVPNKTQLDYFNLRAFQNHDIEHVLIGAGFDYIGELIPYYFRINTYFKVFSPELAGQLGSFQLFGALRYTVRTMLHYPECWPAANEAIGTGMQIAAQSTPFLFEKLEPYFALPVAEARQRLGVRGVKEMDTERLSDIWAERIMPSEPIETIEASRPMAEDEVADATAARASD